MPDLLAGTRPKALDWPPTEFAQDATTVDSITSTTPVPGSPEVGTTFTANTFGKAIIIVGGIGRTATGSFRLDIGPQVFLGTSASGTEIAAPALSRRAIFGSGVNIFSAFSRATRLIGLIPGATYYARTMHLVNNASAAGEFIRREVFIIPTS